MAKFLKKKVYLKLPGTGKKIVRIPVKAKPLKRSISFFRKKEDVQAGLEGECASCANAVSAVRNGICELAQFTDSRVYFVDKFNKQGVPIELTIGVHDQGKFQRQFDTNKKALLQSDKCEGIVTIYPFDEKRHRKPSGPSGAPTKKTGRVKAMERGAVARARRAGIMA